MSLYLISETIAFTAALTSFSSIPFQSAVEFNEVVLNEGDGWAIEATIRILHLKLDEYEKDYTRFFKLVLTNNWRIWRHPFKTSYVIHNDQNAHVFIIYRYNSSTGTFTVPPGGDGFYYFSAYFTVWYYEYAAFDIQINEERICTAWGETDASTFADRVHTSCSATTYASEGKTIKYLMLNYSCLC